MTKFTISISNYDRRAKALVKYLKTLDFVTIVETSENEYELSEEELDAVKRGLKDIDEGKVYSDEEVRKRIHKKIENAGKK